MKKIQTYKLKKLIPGNLIESGLAGFYGAVPDRGFKGKPFKIKIIYPKIRDGELRYVDVEREVDNWNRAERYRKFMDHWGRGAYTLGYFKMCDEL